MQRFPRRVRRSRTRRRQARAGRGNSGALSSGASPGKDGRPPPKDSSTPAREASPVPKDASAQPSAATDPTSSSATQVQRAEVAGEPAVAEIFEREKPVVVVSEAAPSAAIVIRRRGSLDGSTSFVWWDDRRNRDRGRGLHQPRRAHREARRRRADPDDPRADRSRLEARGSRELLCERASRAGRQAPRPCGAGRGRHRG